MSDNISSHQYNNLSGIIPYEINTAKQNDFRGSDITTFWDPGITVFSPNRKFSVDLYKKPSTQIYYNSPGKATPLLLNLHFWRNPFSVLLNSDKPDKLFFNFTWLRHYRIITLFTWILNKILCELMILKFTYTLWQLFIIRITFLVTN